MKTVKIGNTNWEASNVALGIMRMNALSTDEAAASLNAAVAAGINFIDSADIYGQGDSEKVFGAALKQSGIRRDQLFIQSKGGIVVDPARSHGSLVFGKRYDFSKQHLIDAVDGELSRMGVDYLDSFLLHRPDPLMEPEEVAAAFDELQQAGKVRHFGVSNFDPQQFEFLQENVRQPLLINQVQFSVMHTGMVNVGMHVNMEDTRSVDHDGGVLAFSRRKHVTLQAWSPFQYGTFAGVYIDNDQFPKLNAKLAELAEKYHVSKNGIAVAWILRMPVPFQVILGTMNPAHIKDSAAGSDVQLTRQEWYDVYFAAGNDLP
ncbi:aldo/keto reductase [Lacticaseibacillus camelliae]|uniref:Oxidoreductase n=1 Tax=Lacticaseibacillus camelliae DSM 22697 = JCM 13995 TaxID=1423730 RepID=A0A0R2F4T6_9LACO|nr:aldo/keto reductase [Lacticaseibacillus camelliae]KRN23552.1 oxidoreductase [Lacticaseibacillus camelliae DSM 22697 = JCM 13995]